MAAVSLSQLSKTEHDELCCVFAALILHDDGQSISAEAIGKLVEASGNDVEKYWPILFAKALQGKDVGQLLFNVGAGAPVAAAGAAGATGGAAAEEAKQEEVPEEEDDALEGGMDLFGGDDW